MLFTKAFWNLSYYFKYYNSLPKDPLQISMKNPKYLLIIKVHEGWKLMATCVVDVHFVGWTQPNAKGPAHMSKPNPKNPSKRQRIESGQPTLVHPWPRYSWRPLQENQVFEDELGAILSTFVTLYLMWTVPKSCDINWSLMGDGTLSFSSRLYLQWKGG